jgi:hypothetical protein
MIYALRTGQNQRDRSSAAKPPTRKTFGVGVSYVGGHTVRRTQTPGRVILDAKCSPRLASQPRVLEQRKETLFCKCCRLHLLSPHVASPQLLLANINCTYMLFSFGFPAHRAHEMKRRSTREGETCLEVEMCGPNAKTDRPVAE